MKKKTISKLKKLAWKACSTYIRKKYADEWGYCICYTCGVKKTIKEIQAGHGFSGRGNSILFEEAIIRPQCFQCNCMRSGQLHIFTYKLRKELGDERFEEIYRKQFIPKSFTREELESKIEHYQLEGGYTYATPIGKSGCTGL